MAVALHHRLAGKKVLTPEKLKGERLLMMRKGWSCHVDALRAELTEKYPEITIADFDFYNVDIFNRCENSNDMLLAIKSWESVHLLMKILPVEWDYKMPYGLLYAKEPSEKVEKLVRTGKELQNEQKSENQAVYRFRDDACPVTADVLSAGGRKSP